MKYCLPDMALSNARLRPVVKTPGGFVRPAGNAGIAENTENESAGNGRIVWTDDLTSRTSENDASTFSINTRLLPFSAFPAISALTAFPQFPAF
jgi:hypothetical protein